MAESGGSEYRLSATLLLNDQLSGKLKSAASQLKSMDGAVGRLARQFDALKNLRAQVEQFKQMKRAFASTQQLYNQSNATTAQLARQYKQGQLAVAQLKTKHDALSSTFEASKSATAQLKNQLGALKSEAVKLKTDGARAEYQKLQSQIKATSEQLKASQAMTRSTGAEMKSLAGGIKQAQRELTTLGRVFEESKAKASQFKRDLTQQRPALDQMRRNLAVQGFSTRDFAQSERDLRRRMESTARQLYTEQRQQHLREAMVAAGMGQGRSVSVNVSGNATSKLAQIRTQLQSLTSKAWNVAVNAKNAMGTRVGDFATGAAMGLGIPFLGTAGVAYGGVDIINTYKDFEYEMKSVSAITGAYRDETGQRLAELTEYAKRYGETTMFKASEVASAEKYMAMAGWSDEYIKAGLKPLLDLAAASGEDLRRTSDIVTDAMTAFHLKPEEMYKLTNGQMVNVTEHFADVMAALATSSNTDVGMAGESAKYSAAIIGAMYSDQSVQDRMHGMEDWAVFQGLMADTGIKASMAGTATRSIFTRMASMQINAEAARDVLGVDLVYREDDEQGHKAGQMRRSLDIINDFRKKFQGGFATAEELMNAVEYFDESGKKFTKRQRVKINEMLSNAQKNGGKMSKKDVLSMANMLSGQEALSGMLALITADDETWNKKVNAIQNSNGRAKEMANVKMDTLKGDLATLSSAWEAFQLELMEGKGAEDFRNFAQGITQDIRAFKKALEDGFDISDIGGLIARVATQLKNKFLEFDGIGSILAGGALVMGLKKIYDWAMKLKGAASAVRSWWTGAAAMANGRQPLPPTTRAGSVVTSVGSMVVHAGSVVINGRVASGTTPVATTGGTATQTRPAGGVPPVGTTPPPTAPSRLGTMARVGGSAAVLTGLFSIFDTYSTRSINEGRLNEAQAEYESARSQYEEISLDEDRKEELPFAAEKLQQASEALKVVQKEAIQHNNESLFGGAGAMTGAATGAAIGSVIPGAGTAIGAIAGLVLGVLGAYLGSEVGKSVGDNFEYDVLDKILGRDKKQADWITDEGKKFSELSFTEKAEKLQNMSAAEMERMTTSVQEQAKADEAEKEKIQMPTAEAVARHRVGAPENEEQPPVNLENKLAKQGTLSPAEMEALNHQRGLAASAQEGATNTAWFQNLFQSVNDFFRTGMENYGKQTNFGKPETSAIQPKPQSGTAQLGQVDVQTGYGTATFADNKRPQPKPQSGTAQLGQVDVQTGYGTAVMTEKPESIFGSFFKQLSNNEGLNKVAEGHAKIAEESARASTGLQGIGELLDGMLFNRAAAAELNEEQQAQQMAMEQGATLPQNPEPDLQIKADTNWRDQIKEQFADFNVKDFLPELDLSKWFEGVKLPDFKQLWADFNIKDFLPELDLSKWFEGVNLPDFKQLWADFSITNFLPDINISQWLTETMSSFELPDISSLLPDFSMIGAMIEANLAAIPERVASITLSIGDSFNQIPALASSAFSTVSTAANDALSTIQSAWGSLPGFFDGLFAGLGGIAAAAGSAIAAGINSGIGMIQSAWDALGGWLSAKISSLSSLASKAASFVNIGMGSNATGTTSWRGGWTEVNERGGEIINLPSGTTIYPHATTVKMIEREIQKGAFLPYNATGTASFAGGATVINEGGNLEAFTTPSGTTYLPQGDDAFNSFALNTSDFNFSVDTPKITPVKQAPTSSNISITGNTFVVRQQSDIDEIAFKLLELIRDSNANFAGAW